MMATAAQQIATSVARTNFIRRASTAVDRLGHREWLHFSIAASDGTTLIVNMSITDDLRAVDQRRRTRPERGRLVVLAHRNGVWFGSAEEVDASAIEAHGGSVFIRLGESSIRFERGIFHVKGMLADQSVGFDLELEALSFPSLASNVSLGPSEDPIHWVVVPRLAVKRGELEIGGVPISLSGALAYHDHNWGYFNHRNFAWQWGHAFPSAEADRDPDALSVVFTRLLNGPRTHAFMQALLFWRGSRQERVFREDEIEVTSEGFLRKDAFTVPKVARLLAGGRATDVPKTMSFVARGHGGRDEVQATFTTTDVAEIVVPNEHDLETTLIREVVGTLDLEGQIRGRRIEIVNGPGVFEWIGKPA
jgi:hypothetical protein